MKTTLVILLLAASFAIASFLLLGADSKPDPVAYLLTGQPEHTQSKPMSKQTVNDSSPYSKAGFDVTPLNPKSVEQLASKLDPETYKITQKAGTEAPFCGNLLDNKKTGLYTCIVCGLPLFSSDHKFTSGTGWPSFYQEFDPKHIAREVDNSFGMARTEITCARCGSHLGHLFNDGPEPTGERHCLNSASLMFYEKGEQRPAASLPVKLETAYFAGGCFWGIEHYFQMGDGVVEASSGYMQGNTKDPDYKEICYEQTGHAETVKVVFDPDQISYQRLLQAFFDMHDPTQLNRQGPDVGDQYRSGIWYANDAQKTEAEAFVAKLTESDRFGKSIVTQIEKAQKFWNAEEYHQDYIAKTGRACHVKNPW